MAGNLSDWLVLSKKIGISNIGLKDSLNFNTLETYSYLKSLGLKTVDWETYFPTDSVSLDLMISKLKFFIENNRPCLFIFTPKSVNSGLKKNYLFDVSSFEIISRWLDSNLFDLYSYDFLITSMVVSSSSGYVGSVFSDGLGKLMIETYHEPDVSNHRVLSQSSSKKKYLDFYVFDNFELISAGGSNLISISDLNKLKNIYFNHKGYFEFVKGDHQGINEIVTTGFLDKSFPFDLFNNLLISKTNRLNAHLFLNLN